LDADDKHKMYANVGYYSRQPFQDNIWTNFTNEINEYAENEKIFGVELGYAFKSPKFSANVDLYRTNWKGRVGSSSRVEDGVVITTITSGQEQTHIGAELSFSAKPVDGFKMRGFVSVGDWQYIGEVISFDRNEDTNAISNETEVDVDGGKVGDAAQFTAGLGIDVNLAERLSFDADWRMYDNLYANVGAVKENLELPSYDLVDMGVSYKMLLGKNRDKSLAFRANVNNVFSEVYLSDLRTANTAEAGDETWNGINVNNQGYFGFGRTWNLSLKYKF